MTGTLFAPILEGQIEKLNERAGTRLHVAAVPNDYFGGDVSVAGLLTGGDILGARERIRGDFVIIPRTTLKSDEEIMLDGTKLSDLKIKLGLPTLAIDLTSLSEFLCAY